ncbi:MAG: GNAT family N-acetyltransferase [Pyrinomonadaceae bacterium]
MLETERLFIRKFTGDDLSKLIELRSDPEVYKYIGGLKKQNPDSIEKRLQFYIDCYEKCGFGMCAMLWKETGEMFGWSGLQPLEETGETEVAYGMATNFWRRGIGIECAKAWLDYGFAKSNLDRIVAIAVPENTGSWRIMEKLGMRFVKIENHYGLDCKFYSISKDKFLRLN